MKQQPRICFCRLIVGLAFNTLLWVLRGQIAVSNATPRSYVIAASMATAGLVFVLPVFWRGAPWQAPIAFVLMWYPGLVLFFMIAMCLH
jgi:hypothetical protein